VEPDSGLGIASQIAVALAGFAGVVTAFRARAIHEWEPVDKFRLRLLLINSLVPLALCLIALTMLAVKPPLPHLWRWASVVTLLVNIPTIYDIRRRFRAFTPAELAAGQTNKGLFAIFSAIGAISFLLLVCNMAILDAFWPFFFSIATQLIAAMFQFMLMLLRSPMGDSRPDV
jgi:hypothetical protein